jgi:hypothetical protein
MPIRLCQIAPVTGSHRGQAQGRRTTALHRYAGVDPNCLEWAFTEPEIVKWLCAQLRCT